MVDSLRKVVRIFLASPGDLLKERALTKEAVDEVNETVARSFGYHIDLIGWEYVTPGFGRPQSIINRDVEQCEHFIGLMWQRWGTPPGSEYSSGFEEEFELALKRRAHGSSPEISLFFKNIAPELLSDPGPVLKQVQSFRQRMEAERLVLFKTFKDEHEYPRILRRCLYHYLDNLKARDELQGLEDQQHQTASQRDEPKKRKQSSNEVLIHEAGARFARDFFDRAENDPTKVTSFDVARLRLLGDVARRTGNDESGLGVHDANRTTIALRDGAS